MSRNMRLAGGCAGRAARRLILGLAILAPVCAAQTATQTAAPPAAPAAKPARKALIAVLSFDYSTVKTAVAAVFGTDQDVGKGITDLLVQKLFDGGQFRLIERGALDKVLAEQNFSNSDRADPNTAAKLARILGVDGIVTGSITQFGRDDKNTTVGGGGFGLNRLGIGGVSSKKSKAAVGITVRIIDTTTAEILASVTGTGESTRSGTSLVGGGAGSGGGGGGGLDMSSSNFAETIIGEAVNQAVASVATQLTAKASTIITARAEEAAAAAAAPVVISGVVADVSGSTLILNVGSKAGVKVGDKVDILRAVRTVKDPTTGKVLKTVTNKIGAATVTQVDQDSATATFAGTGSAKVGDAAKTP
jgi:curli biogenesis system outer membrane secretion channel CsgG